MGSGGVFEASGGGAGKGRAHHRQAGEHVGADQRAAAGDERARVVPEHARHALAPERGGEPDDVAREIGNEERRQAAVVVGAPARRASETALIGGDDVVAGRRQRGHDGAPAPRQFGEAVEQEHAGAARVPVAGLEDVHGQAVAVVEKARAHSGGEGRASAGSGFGHGRCLRLCGSRGGAIVTQAEGPGVADSGPAFFGCGGDMRAGAPAVPGGIRGLGVMSRPAPEGEFRGRGGRRRGGRNWRGRASA